MKNVNTALRIAFVLDDGLDSEDGVQQYIRSLGTYLIKKGHEVHYLVGETKRTDIKNVYPLAKNVRVTFNGNKLTIPLPANRRRIKKILAANRYDVLHVQIPYSPFFGAKVVRYAPKNTVVLGTFHILPYGTVASLGTRLLGQMLRRNLRRFDKHLAVSSAAQVFARRTFMINAEVLPNVVDITKFKPKQTIQHFASSQIQLLFLGRLVERKGCSYLLNALALLHQNNPDIKFTLTVCGKGPLLANLEQQSKELGISDQVIFAGFVSDEDKIQYLQKADVAIFPSYAGESFGIVLLEAMAAGAGVVLGGDNPGYRSVLGTIEDSLVDVRDTQKFMDTLRRIATDTALRNRLHNEQQAIVQQYGVETVGKKLLKTYRDCKKSLSD